MKRFFALTLALCMILSASLTAIPAFAADDWHAGWKRNGTVNTNGKAVTIKSEGGASSYITLSNPANLADQFDVEFTLQMKTFGNQNVQIKTGKHRAFFGVTESTITNSAPNGSATATSFPFNVGYKAHTYRIIGNNGQAEFYADGYYIGKAPLEVNDSSKEIHIWNTSSTTSSSEMVLTNVIARPYKGSLAEQGDESQEEEEEKTEEVVGSVAFHHDFDDPNEEKYYSSKYGGWEVHDGVLETANYWDKYFAAAPKLQIEPETDFHFKMRVKFTGFSQGQGFQFFWPNHHFYVTTWEDRFTFSGLSGSSSDSLGNLVDDQFHIFEVQTYNDASMVKMSLDGKLLADMQAANSTRTDYHIYMYTFSEGGNLSGVQIDWVDFQPTMYDLVWETPYKNATYLEGKEIPLKAIVRNQEKEIPQIDYKIDGQVVATGYAPNYEATLSNLRAGEYTITAEYGDSTSKGLPINIVYKVDGELKANLTADGNLSAGIDLFDKGLANVINVEYFLDGEKIGETSQEPYRVQVSGVSTRRHKLDAICRDAGGTVLKTFEQVLDMPVNVKNVSQNYSNDMTYTVTGDSGVAIIEHKNGNHRLYLKHTTNGVVYLTDTGEETYELGTGDFEVITDGAIAEVYRYGQLAFTFYMPMTEEVGQNVSEQGLSVVDYQISMPIQRNNYFVKENVTNKNAIYQLGEIPFYHVTDFVADKNDEFQLVVNDSYFQVNLKVEDGKIKVLTTQNDNTPVFEKEILDISDTEGKVYYRIENGAGMCRLYANGRWKNTFRAIHTTGKGYFAVNVTGGDGLDYLAVSDNHDLAVYTDEFDGKGVRASDEFWAFTNMGAHVEPDAGRMILHALERTNAMAEINAFAAEFNLVADVNVQKLNGGFYFILSHSVTSNYSKIGYNATKKQFEHVDVLQKAETVKATKESETFPVGETVRLELVSRRTSTDKQVILYVNGQPMIGTDEALNGNGTFGFLLDDAVAYIENVSYRGDAKILHGLYDYPGVLGDPATLDMIEDGDKIMLVGSSSKRVSTIDGGKSWQYEEVVSGDSNNIVALPTGELISVVHKQIGVNEMGIETYQDFSYISYDNGKSWTEQGPIQPSAKNNRITMGNRIKVGASGRIYFACCDNNDETKGHIVIWYSDNKGKTWTKSKTEFKSEEQGYPIQEAVCLETESGVVRAYFRNESGCVNYYNSYDYGETFDLTRHATPFLSAQNCFNIERDPYDGKTLYFAWGYDNAGLSGSDGNPRTRWAIAKSVDDGETWEYVGTGHEKNEQQGSIMMNLNINVAKDYLVLECMSLDDGSNSQWYGRRVTVPKDQVSSKRFDQVHCAKLSDIENTVSISDTQKKALILDPDQGVGLVNGDRTENVAVADKVAIDYIAGYVGALVKEEGDSIILKRGDAEISFAKSELLQKDGKWFVTIGDVAEKYGLFVNEIDNIIILSIEEGIGEGKKAVLQTAIDLF